jgi:hypothetical protein
MAFEFKEDDGNCLTHSMSDGITQGDGDAGITCYIKAEAEEEEEGGEEADEACPIAISSSSFPTADGCNAEGSEYTTLRTGECLSTSWTMVLPACMLGKTGSVSIVYRSDEASARDAGDTMEIYVDNVIQRKIYNDECNFDRCKVSVPWHSTDTDFLLTSESSTTSKLDHMQVKRVSFVEEQDSGEHKQISWKTFRCASRTKCVDRLDLDLEEFVSFQCTCIDEHYEEYMATGGRWPAETTQMCKDFIYCLKTQHNMASRLLVSIARAINQQDSLGANVEEPAAHEAVLHQPLEESVDKEESVGEESVGEESGSKERFPDLESCFMPSNLTYAALVECNCLKDLVRTCGESLVEDTVHCLFEHACEHKKVCQDWKDSHCSESALQMRSGSQERSLLSNLFPSDEATLARERKELEAMREEIAAERKDLEAERKEFEALRNRSTAGGSQSLISVDEHFQLESTLQSKCA